MTWKTGKLEIEPYWRLSFANPVADTVENLCEEIRHRLEAGFRRLNGPEIDLDGLLPILFLLVSSGRLFELLEVHSAHNGTRGKSEVT